MCYGIERSVNFTHDSVGSSLPSIHYRPIRPGDWHRLHLFHQTLSRETVEQSFHGAKRELTTPLAHRLSDVDGREDFALVATTGTRGRIIGLASCTRVSPTCSEIAVVSEDAYQHHGVGRQLTKRLREMALKNGITEFITDVLPGNDAALRLLHEAGSTHTNWEGGEIDVHVDLKEESQARHGRRHPNRS
jgi:acetyltransferase